jgi:hypothetical protein
MTRCHSAEQDAECIRHEKGRDRRVGRRKRRPPRLHEGGDDIALNAAVSRGQKTEDRQIEDDVGAHQHGAFPSCIRAGFHGYGWAVQSSQITGFGGENDSQNQTHGRRREQSAAPAERGRQSQKGYRSRRGAEKAGEGMHGVSAADALRSDAMRHDRIMRGVEHGVADTGDAEPGHEQPQG